LRKTVKLIEELVTKNRVVVGNIGRGVKEEMERDKNTKLRHRIHQWSVSTLVKLLEERPVHVVKVSERGSSSTDPFTGAKIKGFKPLMIRFAVKGARRVNASILERDIVGAINIGLKYLPTDGSPMALGSTSTHGVRVKR